MHQAGSEVFTGSEMGMTLQEPGWLMGWAVRENAWILQANYGSTGNEVTRWTYKKDPGVNADLPKA